MSSFDSPYPGLRSFTREEDSFFFGRDEQIDALLEKLSQTRFLPVVGPSGCGKSSLIRAGLMASLEGGLMDSAGARWEMAEMRPGKHPYAALAEALLSEKPFRTRFKERKQGPDDPAARIGFLRAELRRNPGALVQVLVKNGLPERTNFLLLVDQFEEIFAARREGDEQTADMFVAMLLATAEQRALPVYVVITMRTDYLGQCPIFHGLPDAINRSFFLTPRLTREQREKAVVLPARLLGGDIDFELANELVNDAGGSPDQLPLLQHLLMRMWGFATAQEDREPGGDGKIHLGPHHFEMTGGLKKGLNNHADAAYNELDARQKQIAETLFRSICEVSPEGVERRRPVTVAAIAEQAGASVSEVIAVANVFRRPGRDFLVPPLQRPLTAESELDISHEALIRNWILLRDWARQEAESAEMYRDLDRAGRRYEAGQEALWGFPQLDNALTWAKRHQPSAKWAARYGGDFGRAMAFLRKSEGKRRRRRLRRCAGIAAGLIAAMGMAAAGVWYRKQEEAKSQQAAKQESSKKALQRGLERLETRTFDPRANAFALREFGRALQAWPENADAAKHAANLLFCNWALPETPTLSYKPDAPLLAAAFYSLKDFYAVAFDGSLLSWGKKGARLDPKKKVVRTDILPPGMSDRLSAASFSPDAKKLVVVPSSGERTLRAVAQIWKLEGDDYVFEQQITLKDAATNLPGYRPFVWSPDKKWVITTSWRMGTSAAEVFQLQDGKYIPRDDAFAKNAAAADFDSRGQWLATADSRGDIQLWDVAKVAPLEPAEPVKKTAFFVDESTPTFGLKFTAGERRLIATRMGGWADIDLASGTVRKAPPPTIQDQFMRFVTPGVEEKNIRFAVALANRIVVNETNSAAPDFPMALKYSAREPICIRGSVGVPVFNADGTKLLTLAGSVWTAMEYLRVWNPALPPTSSGKVSFDGTDAPKWVAPLALAVTGLRVGSEDDEEQAPTLKSIEETTPKADIYGPYIHLWRRYFGEAKLKQD